MFNHMTYYGSGLLTRAKHRGKTYSWFIEPHACLLLP